MAYTAPTTVVAGQTYSASAHNVIVNDVIDHESRLGAAESLIAPFSAADWTSWTPTFTGFSIGTGGSASSTGRYIKIGTMIIFWGVAVLGTSGTSVGDLYINLPVTAADKGSINARVEAVDTGVQVYPLYPTVEDSSTGSIRVLVPNASGTYLTLGLVSSTVPFSWGAGDKLRFGGSYEAATP